MPCEIVENTPSQWEVKFCNLVQMDGAGTYSFTVHSALPVACVYSAQGQTPLSTDGGFVTDVHDDNVQDRLVSGNNGIERYPLDGVPSYLAFAIKYQQYPIQALSIVYYVDGQYSNTFPVNTRYQCGANFYAGPYTCSNVGFYHVKVNCSTNIHL